MSFERLAKSTSISKFFLLRLIDDAASNKSSRLIFGSVAFPCKCKIWALKIESICEVLVIWVELNSSFGSTELL